MVKADTKSEKESFALVTFFYGASLGVQMRYTNWDNSYLGHQPEPRMELDIPANKGTFGKQTLKIVLPIDNFTGRVSSGVPHSPIYVIVEEVTQGLEPGDQNSSRVLFTGQVERSIKTYLGANDRMAFLCLPVKARLDVPLGVPCNHQCANTLFKGSCGVSPSTHTLAGGIASSDGAEITVTTATVKAKGAADARYWKRGYLQKEGLRIAVRDYDGSVDTEKFQMVAPIPSDWIGGASDVTFVAGCDKSVETCRSRFNGEEFFKGLGYSIPAYNPIFENPS